MPEPSSRQDSGAGLAELDATTWARRALLYWGISDARLSFVSARENIVFRVDTREQKSFALRIHRPGYHSLSELESENEWTLALGEFGIETPRPIATLQNTAYAQVPWDRDDDIRVAGLIEWVDGDPMTEVLKRSNTNIPALMTDIGKLIGRMHNQATQWTPSARFVRPLLDADALIGANPWWGSFWDLPEMRPAQSQCVLAARDQLYQSLIGYERRVENFSMIHSDILPQNMMLCDSRPFVFDFDDSGFGWHVYDLAAALVAYIDEPDLGERARKMIAGYRSSRALPEADLQMLPTLMLSRLMVQLGWMHHRVPVALQISPTQTIPRADLLAPRIARVLAACQRVVDGKSPVPMISEP